MFCLSSAGGAEQRQGRRRDLLPRRRGHRHQEVSESFDFLDCVFCSVFVSLPPSRGRRVRHAPFTARPAVVWSPRYAFSPSSLLLLRDPPNPKLAHSPTREHCVLVLCVHAVAFLSVGLDFGCILCGAALLFFLVHSRPGCSM